MKKKIIFGSMVAVFVLGFVFFQNFWVHDYLGKWTTIYDIKNQVSYLYRVPYGNDCDYRIAVVMGNSNISSEKYFYPDAVGNSKQNGVHILSLAFERNLPISYNFSLSTDSNTGVGSGSLPALASATNLIYNISDQNNNTSVTFQGQISGPGMGGNSFNNIQLISRSNPYAPLNPAYVQARCHKFHWSDAVPAPSSSEVR